MVNLNLAETIKNKRLAALKKALPAFTTKNSVTLLEVLQGLCWVGVGIYYITAFVFMITAIVAGWKFILGG